MKTTTSAMSRPSTVLTATTLIAVLSLVLLNACCLRTVHAQDDDNGSTSTGSVVFDQANARMRIDEQYAQAQIAANQARQERMLGEARMAAMREAQPEPVSVRPIATEDTSVAPVTPVYRQPVSSSSSNSSGAWGCIAVFVIGIWIWLGASKK